MSGTDLDRSRAEVRERRRALSSTTQAAAATRVGELAWELEGLCEAQDVAVYEATDGELAVGPIVERCWRQGIRTWLPVVVGDRLAFAHYGPDTRLQMGRFGIPEPAAGAARSSVGSLDVVLVPVVLFDRAGHRVGRGRGYYDRALRGPRRGVGRAGPLLVGVAHAFQEVRALEPAWHDVAVDVVLTPGEIIRCLPSDR